MHVSRLLTSFPGSLGLQKGFVVQGVQLGTLSLFKVNLCNLKLGILLDSSLRPMRTWRAVSIHTPQVGAPKIAQVMFVCL